jgi:hypothetical protein
MGLFADLDNIFYEVGGGRFRLKHFYQGVKLDLEGNYVEGFDLGKLYKNKFKNLLPFPPEIDENIYT